MTVSASTLYRRVIPVGIVLVLAASVWLVLIHSASATSSKPSTAAVGGVAAAGGHLRTAAARPAGFTVGGIDVSKWQGTVDWAKVAATDQFAYVKATEGTTYLSDTFAAQYAGAKAAGLYVGAYAFGRPDSPPIPQADYFIAQSKYATDGKTLPPMLDIEWPYQINSKYVAPYPCYGLTPAQIVSWIRLFVDEVHRLTGSPSMIYTTSGWWNGCTGNTTAFNDQYLDVAAWSATPPTTLPTGFDHWTLWQYASSGSLPGDQDVYAGTLDQFTALTPTAKCARIPSDFNGDGYADVAVGEPGRSVDGHTNVGAVRVFYGGPHGLTTTAAQYIDLDTPGVAGTAGTSDRFGASVAAGYFDGGCQADLAIGTPGKGNGTVTILHGTPTGLTATGSTRLSGRTAASHFGIVLATADLTRDGYDDLVIGAPAAASNAGEIAVAAGGQAGLATMTWINQATAGVPGTSTTGDQFGASLAVGDVTGDRLPDITIGVPGKTVSSHTGAGEIIQLTTTSTGVTGSGAHSYSQSTTGIPGSAQTNGHFGAALATGDITGDGTTDLAIGAPGENVGTITAAGTITVLHGSPTGITATGAQSYSQASSGVPGTAETSDQFGAALAAGDINGDGYTDLVIGDPRENDGSITDGGAITTLYGTTSGLTTTGAQTFDQGTTGVPGSITKAGLFGASLHFASINSGYPTVIIGTPGYGSTVHPASGAITTLTATATGLSTTGSIEYTESGLTPGIAAHDTTGSSLG